MAGRTTTTAQKQRAAAARRAEAKRAEAAAVPGEVQEGMPSPEEIGRDILRASIEGLIDPVEIRSSNAEAGEPNARSSGKGLTVEEISQLLQQREELGYLRGHVAGYREAREGITQRINTARSEAVAGTLMMVGGQLEGVLHELAKPGEGGKRAAAEGLAVLMAELARATTRYTGGEASA